MEPTSNSSLKRKYHDEPVAPNKKIKTASFQNIYEKLLNGLLDGEIKRLRDVLTPEEIKLLESAVQSKKFITAAARSNNWKVVDELIHIGVKVNFRDEDTDKTLSDWAYGASQFAILSKILESDGPYPTTTENGETLPVKEKILIKRNTLLKAAVEKRMNLHNYIRNNEVDMVKQFVKENEKLKHAYIAGNKSALSTALEHKRFYLYSFLLSNGFKVGLDLHFQMLESELTVAERRKIRDCNRELCQQHEKDHIYKLVNKSRLAPWCKIKNFADEIVHLYEKLDSFAELQPILKIVAESEEADIVFDFNSGNVYNLDPTANKQTTGLTYESGHILIGASRNTSDLLGTLIHELMHHAMRLVYENDSLPFFREDLQKRIQMENFLKKYDKTELKTKCDVIARVYNYDGLDVKIAELIVRPAQLIAMYNGRHNIPSKIIEAFTDLFDYFLTETITAVSNALPSVKNRMIAEEDIRKFNQHLGFLKQYKESKIYCKKSKRIFQDITGGDILIRSQTPELVAANLVRYLDDTSTKVDSKYLFTDLKTLLDHKFDVTVFNHDFKPTLVVTINEKNELKELSLKSMSSKCGGNVAKNLIANTDNFSSSIFSMIYDVNYDWSDLEDSKTHSSKRFIQAAKFKLHNRETSLNMFMMPDSIEVKNEPLTNILELVLNTEFDEEVPSPFLSFSIKREFKSMIRKRSKIFYIEDLVKCVADGKPVLVADVAGMGKSTSAIEIARKLKESSDNWIAFIDLKNHLKCFKKDHEKVTSQFFDAKFFSERIFELNSRPELKFLFESMFKGIKVTFIIDGFDEISPSYKKFVLELLSFIKESKNRMLVTTRVHLRSVLEDHLQVSAFNLLPLEADDRVEFIAKYWASDEKKEEELKKSAKKMLKGIENSLKGKQKRSDMLHFFGVPMHLYMLADQTKDQIDDIENFNFNVYDLYHKFVSKKLKHCEDRGGPLADDDRESLSSYNKFEVYQKVAMEYFFNKKSIETLQLRSDVTPMCNERIISQGLIRSNQGRFEFLHTSYAEFFVANYILMQLGSSLTTFHEAFFKILLNEKFENVRKFLNEGLNPSSTIRVDKITGKNALKRYLTEKVQAKKTKGTNNRKLLHLTLSENHIELLKLLLSCLVCTRKKKVEILTNMFKKDRTIHLAITETGTDAFELIFQWLGPGLSKDDLEKILKCKGKNNDTIRDRALAKNNNELVAKIAEKSKPFNLKQRTLFSYFKKILKT